MPGRNSVAWKSAVGALSFAASCGVAAAQSAPPPAVSVTPVVSRQVAETVNQTLEELPEELRTAITLREIEGLSYEDIANIMNCPIGTVRSRIFRAREAIAERLRPLLGTRKDRRW